MDINKLLSALTDQAGASNSALDANGAAAAQTTSAIGSSADSMNAAVQRSIQLSSQAAQQAAEIERQKAAVGEQAQRVANLDPDNLNSSYVSTMAQLTATTAQREAAMQQYRTLTETSLLDNPIGYIFNQLELPKVVQQHNNLAIQQGNLESDLATRTQLLAQNKSAVSANVASAGKEAALSAAAAIEAAAQAEADKIRIDNFGKISAARMNEQALLDKKLSNTATLYSAGMSMAQFKSREAELLAARQERQARLAEASKNKEVQDAQDSALAAGLARVSGALGYPDTLSVDDFKKMPASKAKQKLYDAAIEGTYGDELSSSLDFLQSGNLPKMQSNDPAFVKGLTAIAAGVRSYATAIARNPLNAKMKPEEATKEGAAQYTLALVNSAHDPKAVTPLNDPKWDTTFNLYRSQDATMLSLVESGNAIPIGTDADGKTITTTLPNNSYVKVLKTVAATVPPGTPEFRGKDEEKALQTLAEMVRTRAISVQQAAADLVRYKRTAAAYNQSTLKTASLNLPVQESAYVSIPGTTALSGSVIGDTMNIASTENLLINLAISNARSLSKLPGFGGIENIARKELLDTAPAK